MTDTARNDASAQHLFLCRESVFLQSLRNRDAELVAMSERFQCESPNNADLRQTFNLLQKNSEKVLDSEILVSPPQKDLLSNASACDMVQREREKLRVLIDAKVAVQTANCRTLANALHSFPAISK